MFVPLPSATPTAPPREKAWIPAAIPFPPELNGAAGVVALAPDVRPSGIGVDRVPGAEAGPGDRGAAAGAAGEAPRAAVRVRLARGVLVAGKFEPAGVSKSETVSILACTELSIVL